MNFEKDIDSFYNNTRRSLIDTKRQNELFTFICKCVNQVNVVYDKERMWTVFKFGGNVWNIDTKDSDLDIAIDTKQSFVPREIQQIILRQCMKKIRKIRKKLKITNMVQSRHPMLSVKNKVYDNEIKIDLSVADEHCLKTTEYVKSKIDSIQNDFDIPIRKLIIFIKYWSKKNGINGAMKCYLSSFGFTLMCIDFCLMVCSNLFLINGVNKISCLVAAFFNFYGFTFDANAHCIDITKNVLVCKKEGFDHGILEIIDPMNKSNNVAQNVGIKQWNGIQSAMKRGYQCCYDYVQGDVHEGVRLSVIKCADFYKHAFNRTCENRRKSVIFCLEQMCGCERADWIVEKYFDDEKSKYKEEEISVWLDDSGDKQSLMDMLTSGM